jgi:hypothetical protein
MSPPAAPGQDQPSSPSGKLRSLIRKLIDCARGCLHALQHPAPAAPPALPPGIVTLLIARLTRGLARATALEARVAELAPRLDRPAREEAPAAAAAVAAASLSETPAPAAQESAARTRKKPRAAGAAPASLAAAIPSAEQIAAEVRRRPIGEVLADICADIGITCTHPLWPELQEAIVAYGGRYDRLLAGIAQPTEALLQEYPPDEALLVFPPDGGKPTGKPWTEAFTTALEAETEKQLPPPDPPDPAAAERTRDLAFDLIVDLQPRTAAEAVLAQRYVVASMHAIAASARAAVAASQRLRARWQRQTLLLLKRADRAMKALMARQAKPLPA